MEKLPDSALAPFVPKIGFSRVHPETTGPWVIFHHECLVMVQLEHLIRQCQDFMNILDTLAFLTDALHKAWRDPIVHSPGQFAGLVREIKKAISMV